MSALVGYGSSDEEDNGADTVVSEVKVSPSFSNCQDNLSNTNGTGNRPRGLRKPRGHLHLHYRVSGHDILGTIHRLQCLRTSHKWRS